MTVLERLFGNAFTTTSSAEMSPEELADEQRLFDRIADEVVIRGLTVPAILFVEMHQPFGFMAGQFVHSLGPFASIVVARKDVDAFARSLCRRDGIERLVKTIEERDRQTARTPEPGEREV